MKRYRLTMCLTLAAAVLAARPTVADDKDFLRQRTASPVLIFILDTSGSMVGSPEEPGIMRGSRVGTGMVPGGGDDPYSRMGIAKRVLRDFLSDVRDATYVLAGYAQAQPSDGSNAVPQKHWVYEARDGDRFNLVEPNYAYRLGYAETFAGVLLDNPADILKSKMIGYTPYFDLSAPILDRYGPTSAWDTGIIEGIHELPLPYDLLPMYFGTCFVDTKDTPDDPDDDETICRDGVFPFYATGERDINGDMMADEYYYGDGASNRFPDCEPNRTPDAANPDDGCLSRWWVVGGGVSVENRRRVQVRIPDENAAGDPNHFRALDATTGTYVGNEQVEDIVDENYDLDTDPDGNPIVDPDYDGSQDNDWVLYAEVVEEQLSRTCYFEITPTPTPTATATTTTTPSATPTVTPTDTPTPLPVVDCADITLEMQSPANGILRAWLDNDSPYEIEIDRTVVSWDPPNSSYRIDWMGVYSGSYSHTQGTHYWGDGYSPNPVDYGPITDVATDEPSLARVPAGAQWGWYADLDNNFTHHAFHEVCLDVTVLAADVVPCDNICGNYELILPPTATPTPYAGTPTNTRTRPPTYTRTVTRTPSNTRTRTPTITRTPYAGTPTRTYTRTATGTRTATRTITQTPSRTRTPTITRTPSRTATRTMTRTLPPVPTSTNTPVPTDTPIQ